MESPKKILSKANEVMSTLKTNFTNSKILFDANKIAQGKVRMIDICPTQACTCVGYSPSVTCPSNISHCSCVKQCSSYAVNGNITVGCVGFSVENLASLLSTPVKLNTIKTISAEVRDSLEDSYTSVLNTYTPVYANKAFLKNFSDTATMTLPVSISSNALLNIRYPNIQYLTSVVTILSNEIKAKYTESFCPCVDNTFELRGGCIALSDCASQSVCTAVSYYCSECNPYSWCKNCACHGVCNQTMECSAQSSCSKNTCPCNCFGFTKGYTTNTCPTNESI